MTIAEYISQQSPDRQPLLTSMHESIIKNDASVVAAVGTMMRKDMILYTDRGFFKYGLASVKEYMSLHCLPIYMNPPLHAKYQALLPDANFQKGCINFKNDAELPLEITARLIADCAPIDLVAIRQEYLKSKKKSAKTTD
jgi:hypothetical protein